MASSQRQIHNFFIHPVTGNLDDSFVGIKIRNNRIDFYYPEAYAISEIDDSNAFRKDVIAILNTISIAKTMSSEKIKIESSMNHGCTYTLQSYLWIIRDFLSNGLYKNREKTLKRNQRGRINWKRTLQTQPIISNGNVIYNDLIVEVPNQVDNIIVEIHKLCVRKSIEVIGWLFGLSPNIIECRLLNLESKKYYIAILKKELLQTFDDKKRILLKHMLKVIDGIAADEQDEELVYGVDSYYYIFERMIDSIFGTVVDISKFNPKADWFLKTQNYKKIPSSELRPDTILLRNNGQTAYILDSKYYRYGTTASIIDLPTSTSIQKQITYGEYIEQIKIREGIQQIRNAFLLPYNKDDNKFGFTEDIEYIGFSKGEWTQNNEEFQVVYAFLIDLKHTITTWNQHNSHMKDIEKLTSEIEKQIKLGEKNF